MEQLSPETLAYLQRFYPGGRNEQQDMNPTQAPDGRWYMPTVVSSGDPHGAGSTQSLGWRNVSSASPSMGEPTNFYNNEGAFSSPGVYKEGTSGKGLFDVLGPLSVLAAPFVWPQLLSAAGFGGSAGAAGGAGSAGLGGFNAAVDSQLANAALGSDALAGYGAAGAGGVTASPIAATTGNSLTSTLSGLLPEGLKGYLGPAATLAGGLLGSKPQTQSATTTRTTDPRFDPAINGLLGLLQNQIGQTPQRSTIGQITPAGNPFTRK